MAEAGLPAPEYRQNEFMVYATIRQHGDVVGQVTEYVHEDTSKGTSKGPSKGQVFRLLEVVVKEEKSAREIMEMLDLKSRDKFLSNYLNPALKEGLVAMTQPNSPKSPTQKYYLTDIGKALLEK